MGLKCSVLGHRFEEPGLVHEREPRGDEVITIRRKVMVCTLCGKQRVLAENKEITKSTSDKASNKIDRDDSSGDSGDNADSRRSNERSDTDSDNIDTEDSRRETMGEKGDMKTNAMDGETDKSGDIDTGKRNDASIIDSSDDESGVEGIDTVFDQDSAADSTEAELSIDARGDDGIVLSDDEGGRGYGEWPADSKRTGTDAPWEQESTGREKNGHMSPSTIDAQDTGEIMTDDESAEKAGADAESKGEVETDERIIEVLCCPACGFTVVAPDSPFRSGDSCPECRTEYLVEKR